MPIPDYQALMLPVLRTVDRGVSGISNVITELERELTLTPSEVEEMLPSGGCCCAGDGLAGNPRQHAFLAACLPDDVGRVAFCPGPSGRCDL